MVVHQRRADLLRRVVDPQFAGAVALVLLALDAREHLVIGQLVGRGVGDPVEPIGDHRLVRIAVQEVDDDLLADARQRDMPPARARPGVGGAYPARAVLVVLALAVPGELHLHPAVLVDVELFALWAHHGGHLRAGDERTRQRSGAPLHPIRHDLGDVAVVGATLGVGTLFGLAGVLDAGVADVDRAPTVVPVLARVADEVKGHPRHQARVIAFDHGDACIAAQAAQTVAGEGDAGGVLLVASRVVVALVAQVLVFDVLALG